MSFAPYRFPLTSGERRLRLICTAAAEIVVVVILTVLLSRREYTHIPVCIGSFFLVLLPMAVENLLVVKMSPAMFVFAHLDSRAPIVGEGCKLYYITNWWDKFLHAVGGVAFVLVGVYLFQLLLGADKKWLCAVIFAFCFSVAVSALWEFAEYGCDLLLGMDMQNDTVITGFHSYYLGAAPGLRGELSDIREVLVNGQPLPVAGYLDIGLHDTMQDMLVETLGALAASVFLWLDKGRHKPFLPQKRGK